MDSVKGEEDPSGCNHTTLPCYFCGALSLVADMLYSQLVPILLRILNPFPHTHAEQIAGVTRKLKS